ncbi:hypothetical protein [Streptomyces sp. NPDC048603]|uniref:hypothetical protein n=1 Tax=Streptomyces sp. NPDC048603 TaxID=3365577 RepID=UPI003720B035
MARKTPLIAVVHNGPQGSASPLAFAARDGVAESGVRSVLIGAEGVGEAQWAALESADGYVLGAPLPDAAEARPAAWQGKPATVFLDGAAAAAGTVRRLGMRRIRPGPLPGWYSSCANEDALDTVRRLGALVALALRNAPGGPREPADLRPEPAIRPR